MTRASAAWRVLVDDARDGAANMAVDEAILESFEAAGAPPAPTLRLYGWSPVALSLGRTQPGEGRHDPEALRREGIDLVRRPTGGSAVLHGFERTYSVVGRLGEGPFPGGVLDTYRRIAEALVAGLARLGLRATSAGKAVSSNVPREATCFERLGAHEIAVGGRKLVGSAQARRARAFLQHGSIPLRVDAGRLAAATGRPVDTSRFTDLATALGAEIEPEALDVALVRGFESAFGATLVPGPLTDAEGRRAAELRCWKYDSMAWTLTGRVGPRERRWGRP